MRMFLTSLVLVAAIAAAGCGSSSTSPSGSQSSSSSNSNSNANAAANGNILTATIDGSAFSSVVVVITKSSNSGVPSGQLIGVTGGSGFVAPFQMLTISFPAQTGTYQLALLTIPNAALEVVAANNGSTIWDTTTSGGTGTITVNSVTSNTATGTFSLSLKNKSVAGTKTITSGVFNVKF